MKTCETIIPKILKKKYSSDEESMLHMKKLSLNQIGLKHNTDKSSIHHNYLYKYEKYFPFKRDDKLNILELGVQYGNSVYTWREYFPNSQILGVDVNQDYKIHQSNNITIEIGSQNDINFLNYIKSNYPPFHLIIDDASHQSPDQILSFQQLFPHLHPQGIYVIEDTSTAYWEQFQGGPNYPNNAMQYFKNLIDEVNLYGIYAEPPHTCSRRDDNILIQQEKNKGKYYLGMDIESINFLNSIIIVTKR